MATTTRKPRASKHTETSAAGTIEPKPANKTSLRRSKVLSSKVVFKGRVFNVHRDKVEEPSGLVVTREVIHHLGSVVILAIDESKDALDPEIVLERQYRHAVGSFLLEIPAGRIEPNESPLAAAKREMIEETGYRAKKWSLLTKYFASPGFLGEKMQIFLARDIREGVAQPEADEQIETLRVPLSEAMQLVRSNKIQDGKTIIALALLADRLGRGQI